MWPLSLGPAPDTALKMGCCSLLWCPGTSQPARKAFKCWKIGKFFYQHCRQYFFPGAWRARLRLVTSHLPKMHLGCWVVRAAKRQEAAPKLLLFSKQNINDWTTLRMTYKLKKKKQTKPTRITKRPAKLWCFYSFNPKHSANRQHL